MNALEILSAPWMIVPAKLVEIREIYLSHLRGQKIDWKGFEARILAEIRDRRDEEPYENMNGVAVIPVCGVMTKGKSLFSYLFSGCSMRRIGYAVQQATEDPAVKSLVLAIDSPGGTVDGTQELAEIVAACRERKPIVAHTDGMMTSAAYWIGSACDKRYISGDTTEVGSIGTVYTHIDQTAWDEQMGDKYTLITSGKYKAAASPHKPLSKDDRAYLQEKVDYLNGVFVRAISANLGVTEDRAAEMADEARIYIGKQAIDAGLVDGVSTFDALIGRLTAGDAARNVYFQANQTSTEEHMDATELKEKHPAVYQSVFDLGKADGVTAGIDAGRQEGITAGAEQERQRIAAVRALAIPGHEALIEEMVSDGKTTAAEAAIKIVQAEKVVRDLAAKKLEADAKAAGDVKAGDFAPPPGEKKVTSATEAGNLLDAEAKKIKAEKRCSYSQALAEAKTKHPAWAAAYDSGKEE